MSILIMLMFTFGKNRKLFVSKMTDPPHTGFSLSSPPELNNDGVYKTRQTD